MAAPVITIIIIVLLSLSDDSYMAGERGAFQAACDEHRTAAASLMTESPESSFHTKGIPPRWRSGSVVGPYLRMWHQRVGQTNRATHRSQDRYLAEVAEQTFCGLHFL